jgi:hypothetical protein
LSALMERATKANADCVGGRITVHLVETPETRLDPTVLKLLGDNTFLETEGAKSALTGRGVIPGTGNALVRRSLFNSVGPFDTSLTYGEDAEWFRRARREGARIDFEPNAVVRHLTPASRLTKNYLYEVAERGAVSRVMDDFRDGGLPKVLQLCCLRVPHLALSIARKVGAYARQDQTSVLGRSCSMHFSLAYIQEAIRLLRARHRPEQGIYEN